MADRKTADHRRQPESPIIRGAPSMTGSESDESNSGNGSFPPLTRESVPELMEITDVQALTYVTQLLQQLVSLHETWNPVPEQRERAPSFEGAIAESEDAVHRLVPARNFTVSSLRESNEETVIEHEVEFESAVELYKRFWLKEVPPITISDYLQRFHRYCKSSAATYLTAGRLIYLLSVDRHIIPVTQRNVYRLFCAAFMVAVKFIEDAMYPMSRYATTAGLKKSDLARLEVTFLLLANYDVRVDREMLKSALRAWAELNASCDLNQQGAARAAPTSSPIPAV